MTKPKPSKVRFPARSFGPAFRSGALAPRAFRDARGGLASTGRRSPRRPERNVAGCTDTSACLHVLRICRKELHQGKRNQAIFNLLPQSAHWQIWLEPSWTCPWCWSEPSASRTLSLHLEGSLVSRESSLAKDKPRPLGGATGSSLARQKTRHETRT